ncbi:ABC transporter substrate-binding protein [Massilia sp. W12]|uniref:substrate-binding periplasmic protein n=1 Tax=Massilia sp. W12 TaxID=3126507 RepID=UPI0030CEF4F4
MRIAMSKAGLRVWPLALAAMLAQSAQAREVKFLFSFALPPYVIKGEGGRPPAGFELEIVQAALAARGHQLKPQFVAMGAMPQMLARQEADGAQRGAPEVREGEGFFYAAEPTVLYQDVAITLQKNNLRIAAIADLKEKSVVGFQGASHFLGPEFSAIVKGKSDYAETSDEKRRVLQLYSNGVQVYVGDVNVYRYYRKAAAGVMEVSAPVEIHQIFKPALQKFNNAVFRDKQLRDDFEAGLKQLKSSGQYKQIIQKYTGE